MACLAMASLKDGGTYKAIPIMNELVQMARGLVPTMVKNEDT